LWLPVIAYMAMLFVFSSFSTLPSPPGDLSAYDVHIAAYAGLGALTARATLRQAQGRPERSRGATGRGLRDVSWRAVGGAILIATAYGVTDEYHQLFTPGRSFDVLDMAADALGSIVGASAVGAWGTIRKLVDW
jgi:VanZ family protein